MNTEEFINHELDRLADLLRASRQYAPEDLVGREAVWREREKLRIKLLQAIAEDHNTGMR